MPTHQTHDSASPAIPPAIRWVLRGTLALEPFPELEEDDEGVGLGVELVSKVLEVVADMMGVDVCSYCAAVRKLCALAECLAIYTRGGTRGRNASQRTKLHGGAAVLIPWDFFWAPCGGWMLTGRVVTG